MTAPVQDFLPGVLVSARGREWVVQPQSTPALLRLRPLGGSDEDIVALIPDLELSPPTTATFAWPDPARHGSHDAAVLLRDSLQLKLRSGAGPFRSFGSLAVEPRAYQLVPLLMALRQPVVRLLVADDVGVGKTIEAGLIVRELLDRGEVGRLAILCPPHLVDQWQQELKNRFHIRAVALTASSVGRLERDLPHGVSLFDHYSHVVVSLDYIKSERHRDHFLGIAPECVIVDEAHACTIQGKGKQLRFELLQRLAADPARHIIMLTATPHSGNDDGFYNLLSILKPEFAGLRDAAPESRTKLREDLAGHFVQRRRKDIEEWQRDSGIFPRRLTTEVTYPLTGKWGHFFEAVQEYCVGLASQVEKSDSQGRHMIWYATLALLRCVSSSPAAAEKALTTRLAGTPEELQALADEERILDVNGDDLVVNDLEPAAAPAAESGTLASLIAEARSLSGSKGDPKLAKLIDHLRTLVAEGFQPVIFCRYIATAHYVADHLKAEFKSKVEIDAVTGEYTPEEREERIAQLGLRPNRILVATDCLSEGINLQDNFDAVIHYDLAWNPTRHEQREGRVDRFGQQKPEVRCSMLYGHDNPVDGFILNVILRKAEAIRKELGILVPMPADEKRISQALIKAAFLKGKRADAAQLYFDLGEQSPVETVEAGWQDAMEKAKKNRTVFAQRAIHPEEVAPEWQRQLAVLGSNDDVARFVANACARFNAPLEKFPGSASARRLLPQHLPPVIRERLAQELIEQSLPIDFQYPPAAGAHFIHRSHPLVSILADAILEGALSAAPNPVATRSAVTITNDVDTVTIVYLLRLRHQLKFNRRGVERTLMAEETATLAVQGRSNPKWLDNFDLTTLSTLTPSANIQADRASAELRTALDFLKGHQDRLGALAKNRADTLRADHVRVREAANDIGKYEVSSCEPVDLIGVYVLLPGDI